MKRPVIKSGWVVSAKTALDFLHFLEQNYIPGADDFTVSMQVKQSRWETKPATWLWISKRPLFWTPGLFLSNSPSFSVSLSLLYSCTFKSTCWCRDEELHLRLVVWIKISYHPVQLTVLTGRTLKAKRTAFESWCGREGNTLPGRQRSWPIIKEDKTFSSTSGQIWLKSKTDSGLCRKTHIWKTFCCE